MTNKRKAASGAVVLLAVAAATTYFATTTTAQPSPLIIIVMENKSYVNLTSHAAFVPYELGLADQGRRFTHYSESPSPSLPNYLLMASGETCDKAGTDAITAGQITVCPTTVWNQLESAGVSWSVYMDDMPSPCSAPATTKNLTADGGMGDIYALKHNPATPFTSVYGDQTLCKAHVLPYTSFNPAALPAVSFISPGICDDQHGSTNLVFVNCYPKTDALYKRGDDWLAANVPPMLAAGASVIVTYDGPSSAMYTVLVGSVVTPGTDATPYTHCSLLGAIEDRYGLTKLGCAQTATALPLS